MTSGTYVHDTGKNQNHLLHEIDTVVRQSTRNKDVAFFYLVLIVIMSNTFLIHVDTQYATNKVNGNPFDCTYVLTNKHKGLVEATLINVQMPIGFYNIRAPYNTIVINGTTYTVPPGNYTSTTFLDALNTTVTAAVGTFSISSPTNKFQFIPFSGTAIITSKSMTPTLTTLLGFVSGQSGTNITATYSYIINFDTYVDVYIRNFATSSTEGQLVTFKIPIDVASGEILHWSENSRDTQSIPIRYSVETIDRLIIQVYDRFGNLIDNNGVDWSFSIQIKSDT